MIMNKVIKYFKSNGGYARMTEIKEAGIHTSTIKEMLEQGIIERVKPGLYRLFDIDPKADVNISFIDICRAVPKGIICLISAIDHYKLSTFNPSDIYVAIPLSEKPPKIEYPPTKFYYFPDRFYKLGVEIIHTKVGDVRIYNIEKTICDIFRYRDKLGEDIAIEALKNYIRRKDANLIKLREYSILCQVKTVMMPYLKALVG